MANAEAKQKKFEDLAEKRVTATIKKLRVLGNLANRNNYSYTDDHVRQILAALEDELKQLKAKFTHHSAKNEITFKFKH